MKKFLILLVFPMLIGCKKKDDINVFTIINDNANFKVSINYPVTNVKKLDKEINNYITKTYSDFNKSNISLDTHELNIDYTLYKKDGLYSIVLYESIDNNTNIKVFNYKNKFISIKDLNYENIYEKANTLIFSNYGNIVSTDLVLKNLKTKLFSIDSNYIHLYYPKNTLSTVFTDTIIIDIPISKKEKTVFKNNDEIKKRIIDPNLKVVALTFDDGPSRYTSDIIEILKNNDAVATFFILGNKVEIYKDILKKSIEYGNEIGNHTYSHKWLTKLKEDEIISQINDTQNIIFENLNYLPTLFRPSYGSINKKVRNAIDLDIVLWDVDTLDWKYKSINKIVNNGTKDVKDLDIILMHETYERSKDALSKIIKKLKEEGFTFVTISELKEIKLLRNEKRN